MTDGAGPPSEELLLLGEVKYFPGRTTFGAKPCHLEWTTAGHIRLVALDKDTGAPVETVFDVPSAELRAKRSRTSPSLYVLTAGGQKHKVDFAFAANFTAGLGGLAGRALTQRITNRSDLPAWVSAFARAGILD